MHYGLDYGEVLRGYGLEYEKDLPNTYGSTKLVMAISNVSLSSLWI